MKTITSAAVAAVSLLAVADSVTNSSSVAELDTIVVEASALSKYRPETVSGGTFTDVPPEELPCVVDTITGDFIREHNPTDLNDLLRYVPGIETGGTSLLVRQPGLFSIRGGGGVEPALDGVFPIGRGSGLFMDPFLMDRVEIVKGPTAALSGGAAASQNANGGNGSINLHMKGARLDGNSVEFQENTSVGRHVFRQRGMIDANEVLATDKFAFRVISAADYYEPAYIHQGSQKGARGRESFSVSPSFILRASDSVTMGVKTLFQYVDSPSYIGIPVYRGRPGAGYGWYESSCRPGDRQLYRTLMVNPWLDWQVTESWLLKFGGSFMVSSWEQDTREPYTANGELNSYFLNGIWPSGNKYMLSNFSSSKSLSRSYSGFARSIYTSDFGNGLSNTLLLQSDAAYREGGAFSSSPWTRYGLTLQDSPSWGWFGLTGGVRYDYARMAAYSDTKAQDCHAVSPRGGITIRPFDPLVFFANVSQTRTPMFGCSGPDGNSLTKPWFNTQYEGGVRVRTFEQLWLSLSTYRIEQENTPVEVGRTASGYVYEQEGRSVSRGAELSLSGNITADWTMMAMYSFNRYTNRHVAPGSEGRDFARYPEHAFTLNTSYRINHGPLEDVVIGGGFRFRSMSYATMRGTYVNKNMRFNPSYIFDLNASVPFSKFGGSDKWILTLGVRNLFDEKYFDTSRHYYECFAGDPRTFEIGVRGSF